MTEPAARADRDAGLNQVERFAIEMLLGMEKRLQTLALIVLEDMEPGEIHRWNGGQDDTNKVNAAGAGDEHHREPHRKVDHRRAQVRFEEDQSGRRGDDDDRNAE